MLVSLIKFNLSTKSPTVKKSLKGRPFAISLISVGISIPLNDAIKSFIGIDETNMSPFIISSFPSIIHVTETIFPLLKLIFLTEYPFFIFPPSSSTLSANLSHKCPGPNLGYQNSSIKDVSVLLEFFFLNALLNISFSTAFIEIPLTRCAPQSADISLGCLPHSFSVYFSKNMLYKTFPNLLM